MGIWSKKIADVRIASEFAEGGCGTLADPWINGIQEAYEDLGENHGMIFLNGYFKLTRTAIFDAYSKAIYLFGSSNGPSHVLADVGSVFNILEIAETHYMPLFHIDNIRFDHLSTGSTLLVHNADEIQLERCEFRGDVLENDNIVFEPDIVDTHYNSIRECFILGGVKNNISQLRFSNAGGKKVNEVMIHHCHFNPSSEDGATPRGGPMITVDDGALGAWMVNGCRFRNCFSNAIIDIKGTIGSGSFRGTNLLRKGYGGTATDDAHSRLFHFHDLADPIDAQINLSGLVGEKNATYPPWYWIWIGANQDNILINGNLLSDAHVEKIHIEPGANLNGEIAHNIGV